MDHEQYRIAVLSGDTRPEVQAHLEACGHCARLAAALARLQEVPPPPLGFEERFLERLREQPEVQVQARTSVQHAIGRALSPGPARRRMAVVLATLALAASIPFALLFGLPTSDNQAVAMGPFTSSCAHDFPEAAAARGERAHGKLNGRRVVVAGTWRGSEAVKFRKVLAAFEQQTGAKVTYEYQPTHDPRDIANTIQERLDQRCPPDVALLPHPGLLRDLAKDGALAPIDFAEPLVSANYRPFWQGLGSGVDRKLYGVWFKAANKSTIWYSRPLFKQVGVKPPTSWRGLLQVAERLHRSGIVPFSLGGADGWTLTDWFENVYLRTAGPERYDKLTRNEIPWTDPTVREALRRLSEIFARPEWLAGGTQGAQVTSYEQSVRQVFTKRPRAAMVYEGDFVENQLADRPQARSDAGVFDFPAIHGSKPAVVVGGDVAVLFKQSASNDAARALISFLAKPEAAKPWARAGGFISPNRRLAPSAYRDRRTRRLAQLLMTAKTLRFDLSDLVPPAFGAKPGQGMWKLFRDYLGQPSKVDAITRQLRSPAAAASRCERALKGSC